MTDQNVDQWKQDFEEIMDQGFEEAIKAMEDPLNKMEKDLYQSDKKMFEKLKFEFPRMRKELISYIRSSIPKATKNIDKKISKL